MGDNEIPIEEQSTYLVVPYFAGDKGRPGRERPLPPASSPGVISWACPSIKVGGAPGTFVPGAPLSVTVTVANYGAGTSVGIVNVAVWWSDPTTAFTQTHLHGQAVVAVPSQGGIATTKAIINTIPASAPSHICLLVRVSSPADTVPSGSPIDPVNDRHWAQLNLNAVPAPGGAFQFAFLAGNPLEEECIFALRARPVAPRGVEALVDTIRAEPLFLEELGVDFVLLDEDGRPSGEEFTGRLALRPGESRKVLVGGQLPRELAAGEFAAIEVVQECEERLIGSLGLVLTRESER